MPSPFMLSAKGAMGTLWQAYRFKDATLEDLFQQQHQETAVRVGHFWCLVSLVVSVAHALLYLPKGYEPAYYLSCIPNGAIALICLACVSYARKSAPAILSIAAILIGVSQGFQVWFMSKACLAEAQTTSLDLVYDVLGSTHPAAFRQLQDYTELRTALSLLNAHTALMIFQLVPLAYVGFYKSVAAAVLLTPMAFTVVLICGQLVPVSDGPFLGFVCVLAVLFLFGLLARQSWHSRCLFFSERSFETALEVAVKASRQADSVLHHKLKNIMVDAAGNIEVFLDSDHANGVSTDDLKQSAAMLRQGMKSCRHRQMYLRLEAQSYKRSLQKVSLQSHAEELTAGRSVRSDVDNVTVLIDPVLCETILESLVSNAFAHGSKPDPDVQLQITTQPVLNPLSRVERTSDDSSMGGHLFPDETALVSLVDTVRTVRLTFIVSNAVNPDRPRITEEYVKGVLNNKVCGSALVGFFYASLALWSRSFFPLMVEWFCCFLVWLRVSPPFLPCSLHCTAFIFSCSVCTRIRGRPPCRTSSACGTPSWPPRRWA